MQETLSDRVQCEHALNESQHQSRLEMGSENFMFQTCEILQNS